MNDYNTILAEYQDAMAKAKRYLQIHHADSEDAVREARELHEKLKDMEGAQVHYFNRVDKAVD